MGLARTSWATKRQTQWKSGDSPPPCAHDKYGLGTFLIISFIKIINDYFYIYMPYQKTMLFEDYIFDYPWIRLARVWMNSKRLHARLNSFVLILTAALIHFIVIMLVTFVTDNWWSSTWSLSVCPTSLKSLPIKGSAWQEVQHRASELPSFLFCLYTLLCSIFFRCSVSLLPQEGSV